MLAGYLICWVPSSQEDTDKSHKSPRKYGYLKVIYQILEEKSIYRRNGFKLKNHLWPMKALPSEIVIYIHI